MAAQGSGIKLSKHRVEGYRNFATKLWNACRFAEMNECVTDPGFDPAAVKDTLNRWIVTSLTDTVAEVEQAITDYRFNDAAAAVYHFVWKSADWYVELVKPILRALTRRREPRRAPRQRMCATRS